MEIVLTDEHKAWVETQIKSLWASKTMYACSLLGLLQLLPEFGDYFSPRILHGASFLSAIMIVVFRVNSQKSAITALGLLAQEKK